MKWVVFALALALAGCNASSVNAENRALCLVERDPAARIAACDAVIANAELNTARQRSIALAERAAVHERQGRAGQALIDNLAALDLEPTNPTALLSASSLLIAARRVAEAEPLLLRAIEVHDSGIARTQLADLRFAQGRYDAAVQYWDEALQLANRPWPDALQSRARAKWCAGNVAGARDDLTAAAQLGAATIQLEDVGCTHAP